MNEVEMQLALGKLTAQVEAGFQNLNRRADEMAVDLREIKVEVKRTNGRVNELEGVNKVRLAEDQATVKATAAAMRNADSTVTMDRVKQFGQFGGWIVAGVLGLLKLLGKL